MPRIDKRIEDVRTVAMWLLLFSVLLMSVPGLKVLAVGLYPWIPHAIVEFFEKPSWLEKDDSKSSKSKEAEGDGTES